MHESFLVYGNFRFLKWAVFLCLASICAYIVYEPLDQHNGGTWLGYTLGIIGAVLILWLMWLGIRKRRYGLATRLNAWLSAHVYLGLSLTVVATLHTGFQFGWNLHTLAYCLMMIVIISGLFGIYAYARYPKLMTENIRGATGTELITQIGDIDHECRQVASPLPDNITGLVMQSCNDTRIGGSIWQKIVGDDKSCGTTKAFESLRGMVNEIAPEHGENTRKLLVLMGRKRNLLTTIRRDVQLKALMDIWLLFHVPISFGLLAALAVHIFVVLYYW